MESTHTSDSSQYRDLYFPGHVCVKSQEQIARENRPGRITALRIQRAKIDAELHALGWLQPHYAIERWWSEDDFNEAVSKARGGTDAYEVEVVVDLTGLREGEDVPLRFKGYDAEGMAYEADGVVLNVSDRKLGVWSVVRCGSLERTI